MRNEWRRTSSELGSECGWDEQPLTEGESPAPGQPRGSSTRPGRDKQPSERGYSLVQGESPPVEGGKGDLGPWANALNGP